MLNEVLSLYNKQSLARLDEQKTHESTTFSPSDRLRHVLAGLLLLLNGNDTSQPNNIAVRDWTKPTRLLDLVPAEIPVDAVTVDTVHISIAINRVIISSLGKFKITRSDDGSDEVVLWRQPDGQPVLGKKALLYEKGIYFDISPMKRGWIGGDNVACRIQFSISGVYGQGDNSWPVDQRAAADTVQLVQERLSELGVQVDLWHGKIVRCDLNRNVALDEEIRLYELIWKAINLPRSRAAKNHSGTGMCQGNKSQSTHFYDKIAQMKKRGLSTAHLPAFMARVEWRIIKAKNVSAKLGIHTVQDLIDNWEELPKHFEKHKDELFSQNLQTLLAPQPRLDKRSESPIESQVLNLFKWCQKRKIVCELDPDALVGLVRQGDLKEYEALVKGIPGMDRKHANDSVRRIRTAFWRENAKDPNFVRRYDEVRNKLSRKPI